VACEGIGEPAGSRGPRQSHLILIRRNVVKGFVKRAAFPLASALRNDAQQLKAKNGPAPAACSPSGAFVDGGPLTRPFRP
jgi:hypothetical protein